MKLTLKLPLAFATAMLVLLCAALYGIHNLNQAIHTYGNTLQTSQQNAAAASDLLAQFKTQVQEWKNTLLRGKDAAALDKHWGAFNRIEADMRPTLESLATRLPSGESRQLVEKFTQSHATMGVNYRKAFEAFKAADFDPTVGDKAVSGMDREPAKLLDEAAARIAADGVAAAELANASAQQATRPPG
jgi:ABC-type transporter Mla subunit MlaD